MGFNVKNVIAPLLRMLRSDFKEVALARSGARRKQQAVAREIGARVSALLANEDTELSKDFLESLERAIDRGEDLQPLISQLQETELKLLSLRSDQ